MKAEQLFGLAIAAGALYLIWNNTSIVPSILGALNLNTATGQPLPPGYNRSAPVGPTQNYVPSNTAAAFVGPQLPAGCDPLTGCPSGNAPMLTAFPSPVVA